MKRLEKFEYFIHLLDTHDRTRDEEGMDELGADGWELVSVVGEGGGEEYLAFFKRRVTS